MSREIYKGIDRIRCDVCRQLVSLHTHPTTINDAVAGRVLNACSVSCADKYWARYQLSLGPYSNTGVVLNEEGQL